MPYPALIINFLPSCLYPKIKNGKLTKNIIIPREPPNKVFIIIEIPFIPPSIIELGIKINSKATADITAPKVIKIKDRQNKK